MFLSAKKTWWLVVFVLIGVVQFYFAGIGRCDDIDAFALKVSSTKGLRMIGTRNDWSQPISDTAYDEVSQSIRSKHPGTTVERRTEDKSRSQCDFLFKRCNDGIYYERNNINDPYEDRTHQTIDYSSALRDEHMVVFKDLRSTASIYEPRGKSDAWEFSAILGIAGFNGIYPVDHRNSLRSGKTESGNQTVQLHLNGTIHIWTMNQTEERLITQYEFFENEFCVHAIEASDFRKIGEVFVPFQIGRKRYNRSNGPSHSMQTSEIHVLEASQNLSDAEDCGIVFPKNTVVVDRRPGGG